MSIQYVYLLGKWPLGGPLLARGYRPCVTNGHYFTSWALERDSITSLGTF